MAAKRTSPYLAPPPQASMPSEKRWRNLARSPSRTACTEGPEPMPWNLPGRAPGSVPPPHAALVAERASRVIGEGRSGDRIRRQRVRTKRCLIVAQPGLGFEPKARSRDVRRSRHPTILLRALRASVPLPNRAQGRSGIHLSRRVEASHNRARLPALACGLARDAHRAREARAPGAP